MYSSSISSATTTCHWRPMSSAQRLAPILPMSTLAVYCGSVRGFGCCCLLWAGRSTTRTNSPLLSLQLDPLFSAYPEAVQYTRWLHHP
jgi:hypothetical protein